MEEISKAILLLAINLTLLTILGLATIALIIVMIVRISGIKSFLRDIVEVTAAVDTALMKRVLPDDVLKSLCGVANANYAAIKVDRAAMEREIEAGVKQRLESKEDEETANTENAKTPTDATTTATTPVKGNHGETLHLTGFTTDQTFLMEETKPVSLQGLTPTKAPSQHPTRKSNKR